MTKTDETYYTDRKEELLKQYDAEARKWSPHVFGRYGEINAWRKKDAEGALRMNPGDAARLGISDGGRARVTTKRGSAVAVVELTDSLQPGHVTLPNGLGVSYPDERGEEHVRGVAPNELTASEDRDWIAGTPWHKHVAARVEALP